MFLSVHISINFKDGTMSLEGRPLSRGCVVKEIYHLKELPAFRLPCFFSVTFLTNEGVDVYPNEFKSLEELRKQMFGEKEVRNVYRTLVNYNEKERR